MHTHFIGISRKNLTLLLLLSALALSLPLLTFLVRQRQDIRPRAKIAQGPAKMFLTGPQQVNPGDTFVVDLYVDSAGKQISAVEAHLSYPTDLLEIEKASEINKLAYPVEIQNIAVDGNIDIAAGIEPSLK